MPRLDELRHRSFDLVHRAEPREVTCLGHSPESKFLLSGRRFQHTVGRKVPKPECWHANIQEPSYALLPTQCHRDLVVG